MRTLGVAILGLFAGLVLGFLVFGEVVSRIVVQDGNVDPPWTFVIGFGPQVTAAVGAVVAVVVDNRIRARREHGER